MSRRGMRPTADHSSGWVKSRGVFPAMVLVLISWLAGDGAWAHRDPPTCTSLAINIIFGAFRADKTTPISTTEAATECETVCFRVRLMKGTGPTFCAFSGGTLKFTLPDGTQTTVASGTQIPCVGGSADPCNPAQTEFDSDFVCQAITPAAISPTGTIAARADYAGGTVHGSTSDVPGVASGMARLMLDAEFCPADTDCRHNFCDATLTDGIRTGLCNFTNLSTMCRPA